MHPPGSEAGAIIILAVGRLDKPASYNLRLQSQTYRNDK